MPDFLVRNIPDQLALQIKDYARDGNMTLNDGMLDLLAAGLALRGSAPRPSPPSVGTIEVGARALSTGWDASEALALGDAIRALERLPR